MARVVEGPVTCPSAGGWAVRVQAAGLRASILALLIAIGIGSSALDASAHVIMGTPSLHLRVAEVGLIVRGRVVDPRAQFVSPDGAKMREVVDIEVLEALKGAVVGVASEEGAAGAARIRFAQDGHEVARYQEGDEALFFLKPIAESRELKALAVKGGPTHVSSQEHDETFLTASETGDVLLAATRTFVASESAATSKDRVALIREATLSLLISGDPKLGSMALASLVLAPHAALVTKKEVPRLEELLVDSRNSIGFRAGLLAELERRGLVMGPDHWLALLEGARASELGAAIRAAGANPSPQVVRFLIERLGDSETPSEVRAEAAIALGNVRDPRVVPALAGALNNDSTRVRNAAIRGLGRLDSTEARAVLARAAEVHSDPATRRRAGAQARAGMGAGAVK